MAAGKQASVKQSAREDLVITRIFDAPREMVWRAWTDPKQMAKWWGPHMFTNPVCEMDVRPGGAILIHMQGPDGNPNPMKGLFLEVVKPERLVFTSQAFEDEQGNFGLEEHHTVTFADQGGKTKLTVRARVTKATAVVAEALKGQKAGWNQSLDRLFALLSGSEEFLIVRMFDAPRELVWKAWTDPERLVQWWGPKGFTLTSARLDLRPGGVFHYSMQPPQGAKIWATFVYREVDAPERLAWVVSFSDEQGGMRRNPWIATWPLEVLSMMTLFPVEEKTALMMSSVPINASEEECKAFEAGRNGMQGGFKGTFDQLDAYLAKGK